ncbi:MAG: hypothetical protein K0S01_2771 [Herbinix sp.]|jgi:hypothetical protein|nr:hypothetical protein [Herbinix sp.]
MWGVVMKIDCALYKRGNILKEVRAIDLSREDYFKHFKDFLYCAETDCKAKLNFVQTKNNTKFFRTFPSTEHKEGCPNEVNYDSEINHASQYDTRINISDKHIHDVLERAFSKFWNNQKTTKGFHKKRENINKIVKGTTNGGSAALFNEGIEAIGGKEPYIITRLYNQITEADEMQVRCIIGYVSSIQILSDIHAYINLTPKVENSVKVHFAEQFKANNEPEFEKMYIIQNYINSIKEIEKKIVCCCIGRVKFVKNGINILVDRSNGFTINGMNFYEIIAYMRDI